MCQALFHMLKTPPGVSPSKHRWVAHAWKETQETANRGGPGLSPLGNKHSEYPVKSEFHINSTSFDSIS